MPTLFYLRPWNVDCEIVTPDQIKKICPLIEVDDLKGGLWIPNDGTADPYKICVTLFDIAKSKGNIFCAQCSLIGPLKNILLIKLVESLLNSHDSISKINLFQALEKQLENFNWVRRLRGKLGCTFEVNSVKIRSQTPKQKIGIGIFIKLEIQNK